MSTHSPRDCGECGSPLGEHRRSDARFCSRTCQRAAWKGRNPNYQRRDSRCQRCGTPGKVGASLSQDRLCPECAGHRCQTCQRVLPGFRNQGRCRHCANGPSPAELIALLRTYYRVHGKAPDHGWEHVGAVKGQFGSWNAGIRSAGLPERKHRWTQDEIIAALQRWAEKHGGEAPSQGDLMGAAGYPSYPTVRKAFGSWVKGVEAAGLTPCGQGNRRLGTNSGLRAGSVHLYGPNRRMVTGQGLQDTRPGTIKHFGS